MIRNRSALGAALFTFLFHTSAYARPITLAEALAMVDASPALAEGAASVDEARGVLEQTETYRYNPSFVGGAGPAFGQGKALYDFELGLAQTVELGGKRGARKRVALAERDAAAETLTATRNVIIAEVRRAYMIAIVAQARVEVTGENESAARELQAAAAERLKLGAATQTEVNVAVATLGRAIAAKRAAERDRLVARQALGEALGIVGTDLEPMGSFPSFPTVDIAENELVSAALVARRDLAAADRERAARDADVDLADAMAIPDPEVSLSWSRNAIEGIDAMIVGLRLELPLWNRNQGNRHAARAVRKRTAIQADALRRTVERQVRSALQRYRSATEALAAFDQKVLDALGENLKLARETLAAGKLGLLEVNVVRRDLVESQLAYLDTFAAAIEARAALETALGRSLEAAP